MLLYNQYFCCCWRATKCSQKEEEGWASALIVCGLTHSLTHSLAARHGKNRNWFAAANRSRGSKRSEKFPLLILSPTQHSPNGIGYSSSYSCAIYQICHKLGSVLYNVLHGPMIMSRHIYEFCAQSQHRHYNSNMHLLPLLPRGLFNVSFSPSDRGLGARRSAVVAAAQWNKYHSIAYCTWLVAHWEGANTMIYCLN